MIQCKKNTLRSISVSIRLLSLTWKRGAGRVGRDKPAHRETKTDRKRNVV